MAKRGNNEGTIYQLPSGNWRAQIYINGYRLGKTKKSKREAQTWLRQTLEKTIQGYTGHGSNMLYKVFLEEWLSAKKSAIKNNTWSLYEATIRNHIIPFLGREKISDITPEKIQLLYLQKEQAGTGIRTIRIIHTVLNNSLKKAVKLGIIHTNPTKATTPPTYECPEMEIYSEFEITQLLMAVKGTNIETLIYFAVTTGLRQSELLGLQWSDINWDRKTIFVKRQLMRKFKKPNYFVSPKTKSGKRTISLGENTIQKLQEHYRKQQIHKKKIGTKWQENDLIFPSAVGTPMSQRNLYKKFKAVIRQAGMRNIRFHDLRHTAASLMLNHGIPVLIVAKRLGHSKVSVTLDTYGHLLPGMEQETANFIDELITPIEVKLHTISTRTP